MLHYIYIVLFPHYQKICNLNAKQIAVFEGDTPIELLCEFVLREPTKTYTHKEKKMTTNIYGWCGKILKVDLSDLRITELETMDYADRFLGGRGIAA